MGGEDGDLVCAVDGEVGVDEDEEVGDGLREGEEGGQRVPGYGVGVEDDGE